MNVCFALLSSVGWNGIVWAFMFIAGDEPSRRISRHAHTPRSWCGKESQVQCLASALIQDRNALLRVAWRSMSEAVISSPFRESGEVDIWSSDNLE